MPLQPRQMRPSGTTGQDLQRLQSGGAQVPLGDSGSAPLNLDGAAPPTAKAPPVQLPNPQPGIDEQVTGPQSMQPAEQAPIHPVIQGVQAGDPDAIAIVNDLLQLLETQ